MAPTKKADDTAAAAEAERLAAEEKAREDAEAERLAFEEKAREDAEAERLAFEEKARDDAEAERLAAVAQLHTLRIRALLPIEVDGTPLAVLEEAEVRVELVRDLVACGAAELVMLG